MQRFGFSSSEWSILLGVFCTMDKKFIGGLINSISRLIHLVACQTIKSSDLQGIRYIVCVLKLLKPVLDEVLDTEIPSDEQLTRELEELDVAVNKSREFMEKRSHKMSKICSVLQIELMVVKVRHSSVEICHVLSKLLQSFPVASQSAKIEHCMQELQLIQYQSSEPIVHALKDQRESIIPSLNDIIKIMETLGLTSPQELLTETIALEKERMKAELEENRAAVDHISDIIALITHIRYYMSRFEQFGFINGVPVPSYFRCPLSLEIMQDPVIVASGQTYERSFIQKWLDNGLKTCPKTSQIFAHTILTPNFTVKALIANWYEDNHIKRRDYVQPESILDPFMSSVSLENFSPRSSFHGSLRRDSISRSSVEESSIMKHDKMIIEKVTTQTYFSGELQSCTHSRTESVSSAITDISSKYDEKACLLEASSMKDINMASWLSLNQPKVSQDNNNSRNHCLVSDAGSDDLCTAFHVTELIEDLKSNSLELQIAAASELRSLTKHNNENRVLIAKCGAITPLLSLLTSRVKKVQENAVTALLNLSISDSNKISIAESGAIEPLIHVLESGSTEAQENSAATLFSISTLEEYKAKIGRSGAIKALVNLLSSGSLQGKKDAATALFNLSIFHENKARIVRAGAVKYLVELIDPDMGMVDKSVALLANLSMIPEGRVAIENGGGILCLLKWESGFSEGEGKMRHRLCCKCV
ncbi:uncharacterized protein A4U43_UnF720 [Asparagus officinalis]|uniref:RING-type E3 ubiquitin transferase n=1 Tax=Asparagus officinalis TaxID=4686 RepID=A0A1R3L7N7_ASPOF|nr:uncharacterized protein A4U43_UnF720 [Asparagus officinalis]